MRSDRESAGRRPTERRSPAGDPYAAGPAVPPARSASRGSVPGWDTGRGHLPAQGRSDRPDRSWERAEEARRHESAVGRGNGQRYDEYGQQYAPEPRSDRRPAVDGASGAPRSGARSDSRQQTRDRHEAPSRGLRGSVALLAMVVVTLAAAAADSVLGTGLGMITLIGLAVATTVAGLVVRRRDLATIVVAPPLVFVVVAVVNVIVAPSAQLNLATVATLLIRGFPAMGVATGIALVLLLVRLVSRR